MLGLGGADPDGMDVVHGNGADLVCLGKGGGGGGWVGGSQWSVFIKIAQHQKI